MKKTLLSAVLALGALTAAAQAYEQPKFFDNWSIGLDGGATTPLTGHAFFGSMRGAFGMHIQKQVTPAFAVGVEGLAGVNTSSWNGPKSSTAIDNSYVGLYGAVDLANLFGAYDPDRVFTVEAVLGAGWGHDYYNEAVAPDHNYFATKAGLNFNFNLCRNLTLGIKPAVVWNMSDAGVSQTSAAYNAKKATFQILAGLSYNFGPGFELVRPYNQAEIDALNGQINDLRGALDASLAAAAVTEAQNAELAAQLQACMNKKPEVVKEVSNQLNSVRYVFFKIGSSVITKDQQPNVEMIAAYMKSHPNSKVIIRGYASKDGNLDFNIKLAEKRAESVKNALIKGYKIPASRIEAKGEGIGNMFEEESWNRVSICTLENPDAQK
ncbi:MAG: OmpA family protein [Muribaculaceae bacterium]|nr:OmpA family protein [Muribaculaceae bacterium]